MGKSSGTNTVTQQSAPPQQFLDAYQNAVSNAQNVAATPYTQYSGNLLAPFNPTQQQAFGQIADAHHAAVRAQLGYYAGLYLGYVRYIALLCYGAQPGHN